ncbi:uncharacterized protein LOC142796453 [Rhipicephalus microplus]|uniref:uncharacterized protein LOC142796453 n=1 Tax=Rhipicephalus microplus TaxID=6941 RepID=UPI003F6CB409
MLELWKVQKVRHYGVLDVDARASNMEDILRLLQALRFQQQLCLEDEQSAQKPTAYIVVGVSFQHPRTGSAYAGLEGLFAQFPVDLLIARTHLDTRDDRREDCRITGPTVYKEPYAVYQLSMVDVVKFLHEKRHLFMSSSVAISISMKARWYRPSDADPHWYYDWFAVKWIYPYPGVQQGQPCTSLRVKEYFTSYFYYCDLRQILNGVSYGIAIFDADQDAWDRNPCVGSPRNFDRMNMVRKLVDHVSKPGHERYPEGCWSLS